MGYNEFVEVNCDFNVQLVTTHASANSSWRHSSTLHKKCPYSEIFWSVFSRIRTEYGVIRIPSEGGKIRTRITPNPDTYYTLESLIMISFFLQFDPCYLLVVRILNVCKTLINLSENYGTLIPIVGKEGISFTVWKWSKYGVFCGPYSPVSSPNTGKYGPEKLRIWTLSTQCFIIFLTWTVPNIHLEAVGNPKAVLNCNIHSKYAASNTTEV